MESTANRGMSSVVRLAPSHAPEIAYRDESGSQRQPRNTAHLVRIPEAARITGLPTSLIRKSFMREEKRPRNVPPPPPHKRIGRAVYILADELAAWVESLGRPPETRTPQGRRQRGRPTVADRMTRRQPGVA
jgi:predicted DNA-binding transcriptional regulator AlpA